MSQLESTSPAFCPLTGALMFCPFVPHCSKSVHSQVTYHSSSCVKVASRPPVAGVCGHVCPVPGTSWYATSIMSGTRCVPVRPGTWYELTKCTQEYVHYPYITSLLHFALFMLLLRTSTSTRYNMLPSLVTPTQRVLTAVRTWYIRTSCLWYPAAVNQGW